jgi:hypothetical protein
MTLFILSCPFRLDKVGYDVGCRILELLSYRDKQMKRKPEVLDILKHIHSVAWPYMWGKTADALEQAHAADDEYMISDNDLLIGEALQQFAGSGRCIVLWMRSAWCCTVKLRAGVWQIA